MRVFWFFILCFWICGADSDKEKFTKVSVVYNPYKNHYKLVHGKIDSNWVAWATISDEANENGWSFLRVVTNPNFPDDVQAYAAGMAEGHLTNKQIKDIWNSYLKLICDPLTGSSNELCDLSWQYMRQNKEWMDAQIAAKGDTDPYWHQIALMIRQIEGLQDGCADKSFIYESNQAFFDEFGFWLFSTSVDFTEGVFAKFNETLKRTHNHPSACSVLIKPIPNDLYVAHDTWFYYTTMVRIIKNYEFNFHLTSNLDSPVVPGYNITFSSYPGCIHSLDDYYLISSGLVVTETTLDIYNDSLLVYIQPQSVLEPFRVMLANRLAGNGHTWTTLFKENNCGTYNNEWMIVNYNLFNPENATLNDGLLWIVEQIPGYCESADVTSVLRKQGYWASYNIPYFEFIFNITNQQEVVDTYGDIFGSYEGYFRARIFKRDQHKVVDIDSMIKMMRYNNYEEDPYSICPNCTPKHNAVMAIASRADLNPVNGTYVPRSLSHAAFGATDMKLTNYSMFQTLQFIAYGGPTHDQQPPFQWSKYDSQGMHIEHPGQPDLWDFQPVLANWNQP